MSDENRLVASARAFYAGWLSPTLPKNRPIGTLRGLGWPIMVKKPSMD